MKIKNLATATLALSMSASSLAAYQLVPNGDFESGGDSWGFEYGNGGTVTYETTGGNTGGYQRMDNTNAGWGSVGISTDAPGGAAPRRRRTFRVKFRGRTHEPARALAGRPRCLGRPCGPRREPLPALRACRATTALVSSVYSPIQGVFSVLQIDVLERYVLLLFQTA